MEEGPLGGQIGIVAPRLLPGAPGRISRREWAPRLPSAPILPVFAILLVLLGCESKSDPIASATPTPALQQAAEMPTPQAGGDSPPSIDQQKELLIAITRDLFAGETDEGLPRLAIEPDARNHRQGGIQLVIEINGDEYEDVAKNKAELDRRMRDAYEVLFTAGHELTEATISARMRAVDGRTGITQAVVYRTRLKEEAAEGIDWAAKEDLDFNEIWDILLLNRRWREALGEKSGLR